MTVNLTAERRLGDQQAVRMEKVRWATGWLTSPAGQGAVRDFTRARFETYELFISGIFL